MLGTWHLMKLITLDVVAVVAKEFLYWGLDSLLLQPCCQLKYHPETARANKELEEERKEKEIFVEKEKDEKRGNNGRGKFRSSMWDLLEYPETSKLAQILTSTSILLVFVSTATFLMESSLELEDNEEDNQLLQIPKYVDLVCIIFFSLEFMLRLLFCPNKYRFVMDPLNFVDFISIAPYYCALILEEFQDLEIIGKASKLIRMLRLMRILRILKMVRHFVGLQSLVYTIYQAYKVTLSGETNC